MAKYLYHGSYTDKGLKGLMKDGGTKRMEVTKKAIESIGGKMEAYYFAFGSNDFFIIFQLSAINRSNTGHENNTL